MGVRLINQPERMKRILLQNSHFLTRHQYSSRSFATCLVNKNVGTLEKDSMAKKSQAAKPMTMDQNEMKKVQSPNIYDEGGYLKDRNENINSRGPGAMFSTNSQETGNAINMGREGMENLKNVYKRDDLYAQNANIYTTEKDRAGWDSTNQNEKDMKWMKENVKDKAFDMKEDVKNKAYNMEQNVKDKANQYKGEWKDVKDKAYDMKEDAKNKAYDMKENAKNMGKDVKDKANQYKGEWQEMKEQVKDKAYDMKENVKEKANEYKEEWKDVKDKAYDMKEDIKDKAYNMKENVKNKATQYKEEAKDKMYDTKQSANGAMYEAKEELDDVINKSRPKTQSMMDKAVDLKDQAVESAINMKDKVVDKTIQYKEEAKDAINSMKDAMNRGDTVGESVAETAKEGASIIGKKAKEVKDKVVDKVHEWTSPDNTTGTGREARP